MTDYPENLVADVLDIVSKARTHGKIKKGTNEVTKAIERGLARLVLIGGDVSPPEIVRHLPILAKEKNTPYIVIPSAEDIGNAAGLDVPSASTAIIDAGDAKAALKSVIERVKEFN